MPPIIALGKASQEFVTHRQLRGCHVGHGQQSGPVVVNVVACAKEA